MTPFIFFWLTMQRDKNTVLGRNTGNVYWLVQNTIQHSSSHTLEAAERRPPRPGTQSTAQRRRPGNSCITSTRLTNATPLQNDVIHFDGSRKNN